MRVVVAEAPPSATGMGSRPSRSTSTSSAVGESARVASGSRQPEKSPTTTALAAPKTPGQVEGGEQPVEPVGALAEILEEQDRPAEVGQIGGADQPREHLQVPARASGPANPPGDQLLEPGRAGARVPASRGSENSARWSSPAKEAELGDDRAVNGREPGAGRGRQQRRPVGEPDDGDAAGARAPPDR